MIFKDEEKFIPKKDLTPEQEREKLVDEGLEIARIIPKVAQEYFEKAGMPPEEIQARLLQKEAEENYKKGLKKARSIREKGETRKQLKKMYLERLEQAKTKGNAGDIKVYEDALKILEREE
jgi:hypothetical protein